MTSLSKIHCGLAALVIVNHQPHQMLVRASDNEKELVPIIAQITDSRDIDWGTRARRLYTVQIQYHKDCEIIRKEEIYRFYNDFLALNNDLQTLQNSFQGNVDRNVQGDYQRAYQDLLKRFPGKLYLRGLNSALGHSDKYLDDRQTKLQTCLDGVLKFYSSTKLGKLSVRLKDFVDKFLKVNEYADTFRPPTTLS